MATAVFAHSQSSTTTMTTKQLHSQSQTTLQPPPRTIQTVTDFTDLLHSAGYTKAKKIANSLQGSIWKAHFQNQAVCIKVTDQLLHKASVALVRGKTYNVQEDVVSESQILQSVTARKECPPSIVKFKSFMQTTTHYFFVMEHGGNSLFNFVKKAHHLLKQGQISYAHWRDVVRIIFKQMVEAIAYIHSLNVVHMDISLENFLINDVNVDVVGTKGKLPQLTFFLQDIQVKIADFGLAEQFIAGEDGKCISSKYCGKEPYKCPEIIAKHKTFDAKANDVWGVTICLFILCVGGPPWNMASKSDQNYLFVEQNSIFELLNRWKMNDKIDIAWINLFGNIFQSEKHRMNIFEIGKYIDNQMQI